jgi:hypothetical protein
LLLPEPLITRSNSCKGVFLSHTVWGPRQSSEMCKTDGTVIRRAWQHDNSISAEIEDEWIPLGSHLQSYHSSFQAPKCLPFPRLQACQETLDVVSRQLVTLQLIYSKTLFNIVLPDWTGPRGCVCLSTTDLCENCLRTLISSGFCCSVSCFSCFFR